MDEELANETYQYVKGKLGDKAPSQDQYMEMLRGDRKQRGRLYNSLIDQGIDPGEFDDFQLKPATPTKKPLQSGSEKVTNDPPTKSAVQPERVLRPGVASLEELENQRKGIDSNTAKPTPKPKIAEYTPERNLGQFGLSDPLDLDAQMSLPIGVRAPLPTKDWKKREVRIENPWSETPDATITVTNSSESGRIGTQESEIGRVMSTPLNNLGGRDALRAMLTTYPNLISSVDIGQDSQVFLSQEIDKMDDRRRQQLLDGTLNESMAARVAMDAFTKRSAAWQKEYDIIEDQIHEAIDSRLVDAETISEYSQLIATVNDPAATAQNRNSAQAIIEQKYPEGIELVDKLFEAEGNLQGSLSDLRNIITSFPNEAAKLQSLKKEVAETNILPSDDLWEKSKKTFKSTRRSVLNGVNNLIQQGGAISTTVAGTISKSYMQDKAEWLDDYFDDYTDMWESKMYGVDSRVFGEEGSYWNALPATVGSIVQTLPILMGGGGVVGVGIRAGTLASGDALITALDDPKISKQDAIAYATKMGTIHATLAMMAPNTYTRASLGNAGVKTLVGRTMTGKEMFREITKEIGEEMVEELGTEAATNMLNAYTNAITGAALKTDITPEEAGDLLLITALSTFAMSGAGTAKNALAVRQEAIEALAQKPEELRNYLINEIEAGRTTESKANKLIDEVLAVDTAKVVATARAERISNAAKAELSDEEGVNEVEKTTKDEAEQPNTGETQLTEQPDRFETEPPTPQPAVVGSGPAEGGTASKAEGEAGQTEEQVLSATPTNDPELQQSGQEELVGALPVDDAANPQRGGDEGAGSGADTSPETVPLVGDSGELTTNADDSSQETLGSTGDVSVPASRPTAATSIIPEAAKELGLTTSETKSNSTKRTKANLVPDTTQKGSPITTGSLIEYQGDVYEVSKVNKNGTYDLIDAVNPGGGAKGVTKSELKGAERYTSVRGTGVDATSPAVNNDLGVIGNSEVVITKDGDQYFTLNGDTKTPITEAKAKAARTKFVKKQQEEARKKLNDATKEMLSQQDC